MVMILGMNGGGVARNGLILWENDATGSRKVFKYLLGLREVITKKNIEKNEEQKQRGKTKRFSQYVSVYL